VLGLLRPRSVSQALQVVVEALTIDRDGRVSLLRKTENDFATNGGCSDLSGSPDDMKNPAGG